MIAFRAKLVPLVRFGLAVAALGVGCQRNEAHDAGEPVVQMVRVAISFTLVGGAAGNPGPPGPPGPPGTVRFEGQGHFARYRAVDADRVPALLGLPDDDAIPLDGCRLIDSAQELDRALATTGTPVDVRLLDAGRLQARGPSDAITLVPKHYPELTPYVAGVVYGNDDAVPLQLQPGGLYEVSGEGGEAVGPFSAQVQAPRAFPSLEVPLFHRGGDLEVKWAVAGEASEPAILTVTWSAHGEAREVRCRVRDDGAFTIGRDQLGKIPPASQLASAEVTLARSHRAPIVAPGAGPGELSLSLREVVTLPVSGWPAATGAGLPPPNVPPPVPPEGER